VGRKILHGTALECASSVSKLQHSTAMTYFSTKFSPSRFSHCTNVIAELPCTCVDEKPQKIVITRLCGVTLLFFAMLATTGCEEKIITAPSATTVPNGDQRQSTDKKETGGDNVTDTDAKQQIATDVPIKPESTTKQTKSEAQQHLDILVEAKQHDASQKNALPEQHAWDAGKVPGTGVFDIESTRNQPITQIGTPDGLMVTRSIKLLDGSNAISCAKWNGTSWATVGPSSADDSIAFKNGSTQLRPKTQRNLTPPHPWDEMLDTPIISTNGWNSAPSNFLHIKRDQQVTMLELFGLEEERKSLNADGEIEKNTTAQYIAAALWTEGTEGFSVGDISRMEDLPGVVNLDGVDYDYRVVNKTPSVVWDSTDSPIVVYLEKLDDDWLDIIPPLLPRQRLRTFRLDLTSNAWTELPVVNIFHDIGRERDYSWRITTQPLVMVDKDDHPMVAWIESKKREEDGYLLSLSMRMTQWTGSEWEDIAAPPASQDVYATISN